MDTRITGSIQGQRQGSVPVFQTFQIKNNVTAAATRFLRIKASAQVPVFVTAQVAVTFADSGTSPTLSVGVTGANYTDFINAASLATAATGGTFLPASNAVGKYYLTADTDIYYKLGGLPNGDGVATIILQIATVNTDLTTL